MIEKLESQAITLFYLLNGYGLTAYQPKPFKLFYVKIEKCFPLRNVMIGRESEELIRVNRQSSTKTAHVCLKFKLFKTKPGKMAIFYILRTSEILCSISTALSY